MAENHELEALDQLVNSEGWTLFRAMVDKQWHPSSQWFLDQLDKALAADGLSGTEQFRQVRAAQREIQKVMNCVPLRIAQIKASQTPSGDSAQSRRGVL